MNVAVRLMVLVALLPACAHRPGEAAATTPQTVAGPARTLPPVQATWSYTIGGSAALNGGATPTGQVISLDLYDVHAATIARLRAAGRYIVCYYSAGTSETYRTDAPSRALLAPALNLGEIQRGDGEVWAGERWLDIRGFARGGQRIQTIRRVMTARLALARRKGCAAVEPDNVDAWDNVVNQNAPARTPGKAISAADQLAYNRWTAATAHAHGLSVLLKNDLGQVKALEPHYDGALNEECFDFAGDCELLRPFRDAGKAIYVVEYHGADFATPARRAQAARLHLNVILTDPDVTRLEPFARFGRWSILSKPIQGAS